MKSILNALPIRFEDSLRRVLEQPRYSRLTGRSFDLRRQINEWLVDLIESILNRLGFIDLENRDYNLDIIAAVFSVTAALTVVVTAVFIARFFLLRKKAGNYDLSDIFEEFKDSPMSAERLLMLSQMHEGTSRRLAVRYKYIAVILSLNENNIITIKPSMTNKQIIRDIKKSAPGLASDFGILAECFHYSWFGKKDVEDGDYGIFNELVKRLVAKHG